MIHLTTAFIAGVIVALLVELGVAAGHLHPWLTVPAAMIAVIMTYSITMIKRSQKREHKINR